MTNWATTADVTSLTGKTVTQTQLDHANAALELHTGRTHTDASARTGARDTEWMRRAVAYQAAWMLTQPDMFDRLDYTEVGKDSGTPTKVTGTAMTLAPLARKALARVSWLRSRSLHVKAPFQDGPGPLGVLGGPIVDYDDAWGAI